MTSRSLGVTGLVAAALLLSVSVYASEGVEWGYEGDVAPQAWGDLSPEFEVCARGVQQSPINLGETAVAADITGAQIAWQSVPLGSIVNNGHTIQVNADTDGSSLAFGDTRYDLKQFHFHHGSEHTLDGEQFPLEIHFVHAAESGDLAVIGVFVAEGEENPALAAIFSAMPTEKGEASGDGGIDPNELLPADIGFYRYKGSLTTPPCSQIVEWQVFAEPIQASAAQIEQFAKMYPNNFRPVQNADRRFVLRSF
ncbi:MAG: carbonic anhydrase [Geminicoccaceae bacterium]